MIRPGHPAASPQGCTTPAAGGGAIVGPWFLLPAPPNTRARPLRSSQKRVEELGNDAAASCGNINGGEGEVEGNAMVPQGRGGPAPAPLCGSEPSSGRKKRQRARTGRGPDAGSAVSPKQLPDGRTAAVRLFGKTHMPILGMLPIGALWQL
eukprot:gene19511-biopygen13027